LKSIDLMTHSIYLG